MPCRQHMVSRLHADLQTSRCGLLVAGKRNQMFQAESARIGSGRRRRQRFNVGRHRVESLQSVPLVHMTIYGGCMYQKIFGERLLAAALILVANGVAAETAPAAKPEHGEYRDWRLLGVSLRHEKNSMRAIVGNDVAINAARAGKTKPWPDAASSPRSNGPSANIRIGSKPRCPANSPQQKRWSKTARNTRRPAAGVSASGKQNPENVRQGTIRALFCLPFADEARRLRLHLA